MIMFCIGTLQNRTKYIWVFFSIRFLMDWFGSVRFDRSVFGFATTLLEDTLAR